MVSLWVATYGLTYVLSSWLFGSESPWSVPLAMAGYTTSLLLWLFRTGRFRALGLRPLRQMRLGVYPLLLLLPVCNLLTAGGFFMEPPSILLMLSVCAAEEIFFRGFLLRRLIRHGILPAVLISSGVFALFHLVNLLGGRSPAYICMQVLCAFTVGVFYGAVAIRSESLIPCFVAHFLTNITAVPVTGVDGPWLCLCIATYGGFGIFLCRKYASITR